jgi:hypothetical protein
MKKSEIYRLAQLAVVQSFSPMKNEQKLEVLRELMAAESLALFCEDQEAEERAAQGYETV